MKGTLEDNMLERGVYINIVQSTPGVLCRGCAAKQQQRAPLLRRRAFSGHKISQCIWREDTSDKAKTVVSTRHAHEARTKQVMIQGVNLYAQEFLTESANNK